MAHGVGRRNSRPSTYFKSPNVFLGGEFVAGLTLSVIDKSTKCSMEDEETERGRRREEEKKRRIEEPRSQAELLQLRNRGRHG